MGSAIREREKGTVPMLMRIRINQNRQWNLPGRAIVLLFGVLLVMILGIPWFLSAADRGAGQSQSADELESDEMEESEPPPAKFTRLAQAEVGSDEMPDASETPPTASLPDRVIGNGVGTMGRASYLIGPTFGRNASIIPVEFFPYLLSDANFFFADVRGFATTNSHGGGNLGLGYRRLYDDYNAWGGASVWYDGDQTTGKLFQQIGLSFEALIQRYELRSNVYLPVTSSQNINNSIYNPTIVGNQLLYTRVIGQGTAMRGFDVEAGYSIPVRDRHIVRGFVGGYFFEGPSVNNVAGVRARVEAVINNTVSAQALYTYDNLFGNNIMVGVSMQFPFGSNHPNTGWVRNTPSPFRFVERNYNVIVDQNQAVYANQVAANPNTNQPYLVEQVNSSAVGGTPNGTSANPYPTVAAAQAAGGDIILVQNGSVLNAPITLTAGQNLFGQGNYNAGVPTVGGGIVPMPPLAPSVTQVTPIIQNVSGNAITLASNTQVAGFSIVNPSGDGIIGSGVSNVSLHDLTFSSIGGDAINLSNPSGSLAIGNIGVSSSSGNGIVINGGSPDLVFNGGGSTITATGNGFVLKNLTGGSVSLNNLSLANTGGSGLVIDTVATNVAVNSLSVSHSGSTGSAVSLTGTTGTTQVINGVTQHFYNTYGFMGNTQITSPNGTGFSANNTDAIINVAQLNASSTSSQPTVSLTNATSPVTFGGLTVNNTNAMGLYANNVKSLWVGNGSFTTVNAPAMDIESSGFYGSLGFVNVNGGAYGIKLEGSTGSFAVQGNGSAGSGGTIQNTTTAGMIINSYGLTYLKSMNFTNNAVGIQSTGSTSLAMSNLNITGSTGYAIDSLNDQAFSLTRSVLSSNGTGGGAGTIRIQANAPASYVTSISGNNITDKNGDAIQLLSQAGAAGSSQTLSLTSNQIQGYYNGSTMVNVNWNGPVNATISNNDVTAYGSGMTGILLQDPTTSGILTATFSTNVIHFDPPNATNGTAIWVINGQSGAASTGSASMTFFTNSIQFQSTGGTGMRFDLYNTSSDVFNMNSVTDLAGGATGILFDTVGPNSAMEFLSNVLTLLANDPLTHRGLIFSSVSPTLNLVTPSGSQGNWIYNTTSTANGYSIPAGTATGGIIIDGAYFAAP